MGNDAKKATGYKLRAELAGFRRSLGLGCLARRTLGVAMPRAGGRGKVPPLPPFRA